MKQGNLTFESQIGDVYNTYKFETIDVDKWNLISKKIRFWGEVNHCRRVYEKDGVYIKLWDADYVRGSTIIEGFSSGFYDSFVIPNFMGLIVDDKMNLDSKIERFNEIKNFFIKSYNSDNEKILSSNENISLSLKDQPNLKR